MTCNITPAPGMVAVEPIQQEQTPSGLYVTAGSAPITWATVVAVGAAKPDTAPFCAVGDKVAYHTGNGPEIEGMRIIAESSLLAKENAV